jgi:phage terminase large subunit GpA-like protein
MVDVNWRGRSLPRGVKLWPIGTDTAKHLLYGRMRLTQAGPGYVHVPASIKDTDEFEQMTAAKLMPVTVQGKRLMRWITPSGKREEGGDCMVYAYAAACYLGVQTYRENSWARREQRYAPANPDLFQQQPADTYPKKEEAQSTTPEEERRNERSKKATRDW